MEDAAGGAHGLLLVGVGNTLRRDDGVGLLLVRLLRTRLPPHVRVLESSGDLTRLLPTLAKAQRVVIVDAVDAGAPPGALLRLPIEPHAASPQTDLPRTASTHGLSLAALLALAASLGHAPRVDLYGVQGADFGWGEGLSAPLAARLEEIADALAAEMGAMPA